ncbi:MAG: glycosyltransferase family 4 protein [Acidimicrobiales bacterium]|nr:glycosyltransferase family 4 protein [Acidimicrobiales bacterium]RZV48532.1 MAG: glycosyltransferase [Acidimicrobiales bacterium]
MATQISVTSYYYRRGGAEAVMLDQNDLLRERGWAIVPFAMNYEQNLDTDYDEYFVEEIDFASDYTPVEKVRKVVKSVYSLEARAAIGRLIDDTNPDIVHAHNVYHHLTPAIFGAAQKKGVPTVMTVHDLKIGCPSKLMLAPDGVCERCKGGKTWNAIGQRCLKDSRALSAVAAFETSLHRLLGSYRKHVDRFIIPSHFHMNKLIDWGLPADKARYLPNAVDLSTLEPNNAVGEGFIFVGRLSEEKGLRTFIEAVAAAGVAATIVGTGPQEDELRQLAADTGADVEFAGYQTGDTLFQLIADSRALVLPSECYENAPVVLLEAYGVGRPVLGSNLGGIPELILDGETGLVAEAGNVVSFAAQLTALQEMPAAEITEMGRAGREFAQTTFTKEQYRDGLLDIYRGLGVG